MPRRLGVFAIAAFVAVTGAVAQEASEEPGERAWSFYASAYGYFLPPGESDYVQPTVTADRGRLHLETRYNYEAPGAGSVWAGCNFSVGDTVTFDATAMLGGVFGSTVGVAPGFKATLTWTKLVFYAEGEYLFDTNDSADSYFYAWSEISWAPVAWGRLGLVGQRTRAYQSDLDVQRGVLVGVSFDPVDITTYVFNLDERSPTVVFALGVSF